MKKKRLFQLFGLFIFLLGLQVSSNAQMMANLEHSTSNFSEESSNYNGSEIVCALSIYCKTKSNTSKKVVRSYSGKVVAPKNIREKADQIDGLWQLCVENTGQCKWQIEDTIPNDVVGMDEVIMMLRMSAGDLPFDFDRYIKGKVNSGGQVFNLKNGVISVKLLDRVKGETSIFIDVKRNLLLGINEYSSNNMLTRKLTCDYRQKGSMTLLATASFQNYHYDKNGVTLDETVTQFNELSVDREKGKITARPPNNNSN